MKLSAECEGCEDKFDYIVQPGDVNKPLKEVIKKLECNDCKIKKK